MNSVAVPTSPGHLACDMGKITLCTFNCEAYEGNAHMICYLVQGRVGEVWGEGLSQGGAAVCHVASESLCREQLCLSLGLGLSSMGILSRASQRPQSTSTFVY